MWTSRASLGPPASRQRRQSTTRWGSGAHPRPQASPRRSVASNACPAMVLSLMYDRWRGLGATTRRAGVCAGRVGPLDEHLTPVRARTCSDLGCGPGAHARARPLRGAVGDVVGVDGSPRMVEVTRSRAARRGRRPSTSTTSASRFPNCGRALGGVLAILVLQHLPNPAAFVAEIRRCLRPGGHLLIIAPARDIRSLTSQNLVLAGCAQCPLSSFPASSASRHGLRHSSRRGRGPDGGRVQGRARSRERVGSLLTSLVECAFPSTQRQPLTRPTVSDMPICACGAQKRLSPLQAAGAGSGTSGCSRRMLSGTMSRARSWVDARTTGAATPSMWARSQLAAVTHQRSPGVSPGNPYCGMGVPEVVAYAALVLEELGGHHRADRVAAEVLRSGGATSVPVEAGERVYPARFEFATQHVAVGHRIILAHSSSLRPGRRRRRVSPPNSDLHESVVPEPLSQARMPGRWGDQRRCGRTPRSRRG